MARTKRKQTIFVDPAVSQPVTGQKHGVQSYVSPVAQEGTQQKPGVKKSPRIVKRPASTALPNDHTFGIKEETLPPKEQKIVREELEKEEVKKTKEEEEKLENLSKNSQKVLYKCTSVFPFDLFPDEISIEPTQINVKRKTFFFTSRLISVPIKNISDVIVQTAPLFASIKVVDQFFEENSFQIDYLKKDEAVQARKIIQGLIIASKEGVDVSRIQPDMLIKKTAKLGHMRAIE
jgi:hypothetical protein